VTKLSNKIGEMGGKFDLFSISFVLKGKKEKPAVKAIDFVKKD
jgi:hypothetical protein